MNRQILSEALGTAFLLIGVVGSGIMAETLSPDNVGVALLGNAIPTGCILYVLITMFGPVSGAHFNPAVSFAFWVWGELPAKTTLLFIAAQIIGGILGVWATHLMFDQSVFQVSSTIRQSPNLWWAEIIATFGLLMVIFGGIRHRPDAIPAMVGLYITGAYWFTASTSFANPAVTIARSWTDTFAGIAPGGAPYFIVMQLIGALAAIACARYLFADD